MNELDREQMIAEEMKDNINWFWLISSFFIEFNH